VTGVSDDVWPGAPPPGAEPPGDHLPGAHPPGAAARARLTAWVEGHVQGVGFRWWVRARALELHLTGVAENLEDGRVKVIAEGDERHCRELLTALQEPGTPGRVARVTLRWDQPRGGLSGFVER
jgi:acylphosphatase